MLTRSRVGKTEIKGSLKFASKTIYVTGEKKMEQEKGKF